MFEPEFYLRLVNEEFAKLLSKPLTVVDLPPGGPRLLPRLEATLAAARITQFNHYRPARYFVENLSRLAVDLSDATLVRFENAFIALNKLL